MKTQIQLPKDPLSRFADIYNALNEKRGFMGECASLRFAAMTALACPGNAFRVADEIRAVSDEIKAYSGWFGQLNSPVRFIVGAMLVLHGDSARDFLSEVERVSDLFRRVKLRRGRIYETMAILLLRLNQDLEPIENTTIYRFKDIYEEMKKYHWWLTGPDDFPACAILSGQDASPQQIGEKIERIYQELNERGFSKGDPLQTAANLLYLSRVEPEIVATRYYNLCTVFERHGVSIWQSDYDELAILSFLDHSADSIVASVLRYRENMKELRPKPNRNTTFNLASGIAFLDMIQQDNSFNMITDAKALLDMQNILNAQAAAAAAASTAAASSAAANSA